MSQTQCTIAIHAERKQAPSAARRIVESSCGKRSSRQPLPRVASRSLYRVGPARRQARLDNRRVIRLIAAPLFIATKLESFASRGKGDYLHHDMEDIVNVLDGRPSIADDVAAGSEAVRDYLRDEFEALLTQTGFDDRLVWLLCGDYARKSIVLERVRKICGL